MGAVKRYLMYLSETVSDFMWHGIKYEDLDNQMKESLDEKAYEFYIENKDAIMEQAFSDSTINEDEYEDGGEIDSEDWYSPAAPEIHVIIQSHPRSDRAILDLLKDNFSGVSYAGGIGRGGWRVIVVDDPTSSEETVSDVLYDYIQRGVVRSVDDINTINNSYKVESLDDFE